MALASRFLRCHLPVVTGLRSLINSSRAGINFMLPTCQVSFYVFDGKLYFLLQVIVIYIGFSFSISFSFVEPLTGQVKKVNLGL